MDLTGQRARAEASLKSRCVVTRPGEGPVTIDPDTLESSGPAPVVVWEGRCSVAPVTSSATSSRGDRQLEGREASVSVPVDGTGVIERGDTLTVNVVGEGGDPALVGVPWTVDEAGRRSVMVLRRLRCVDTRGTDGVVP